LVIAVIAVLGIVVVMVIRGLVGREPPPETAPPGGELAGEARPGDQTRADALLDSVLTMHSPAIEGAAVGEEMATPPPSPQGEAEGETEAVSELSPPLEPPVARETDTLDARAPATLVATVVFGVHVSSLKSEEDAWRDADRFYDRGYSVAVRGEDITGKGHWYRVYVGPFTRQEDADRVAAEIRETGLKNYTMVRRLPASMFEQPQGGVRGER
jgi:cell division septation protein DedD